MPRARGLVDGAELSLALVVDVVEVEELADFLERKAEAASAQDELQARAFATGVETALAFADRREKLLGLVEAKGARRDVVGLAHLADCHRCFGHGSHVRFLAQARGDGGPTRTQDGLTCT